MCKIPAQDFFANEFGLPLTMIPSKSLFSPFKLRFILKTYMGFEMVYGQVPPPFEEDPVENSLALQIFC
ncbi:hypothetical protein POTOM_014126 [Populus tomentosa]|uniref:Beta-carotene isomerase D27-like C-terminal domain-containing protein n=1 Tax=Populus tomentosa TaxID=118781 RepID=A0A8X8D816_POPTO|nr:hypothetical protein POTOM_014126 [Populus tomentosa]